MPVSNILIENDDATKFYTGLSSWSLFQYLLSQLIQYYPCDTVFRNTKLSPVNGLLMVLMRLRLNLRVEDLSYRFKISLSSVYDHFTTWIEVMYVHLRSLIKWPTKVTICANMPQIFKDLYPHARCIIDCSEIFIQRPYGYQARAQSYSNYKKHNTAKFLIAITPCGAISFVSQCYGGRASDKYITKNSGFLSLLEDGDVVLADRGFDIKDDIVLYGAKLEIPSFTRGKPQLSAKDVEYSKRLSKVRIHVERIIGLMKNKYTILQSTLPVDLIKHKYDNTELANIDKILTICCALTNLSSPIIPSNASNSID